MNRQKALEIIEDFKKFGVKGTIKDYPKEEIKETVRGVRPQHLTK